MDIEVTTKKRRVSVKRIVIPVAVVLIVSGLAFGAYRMYKDEQAITRINNDLYAVRKDFYDGNYYGKDNFYSLSELVQENWKPTYSLVSQTVEKKSVLDQNATYEKQSQTGNYSTDNNVYSEENVRMVEMKIENKTSSLYTFSSYELQPIDKNGVPLSTDTYAQLTIKGEQQVSSIYIEPGQSATYKFYYLDTGEEIKRFVNTNFNEVIEL